MEAPIDRRAVVGRHSPELRDFAMLAALGVLPANREAEFAWMAPASGSRVDPAIMRATLKKVFQVCCEVFYENVQHRTQAKCSGIT